MTLLGLRRCPMIAAWEAHGPWWALMLTTSQATAALAEIALFRCRVTELAATSGTAE
jgi:hypothetical protein